MSANDLTARTPIEEYTGSLDALGSLLAAEANRARGVWARRRIRSGTVISMRHSAKREGEWRLAIARDLAPSTLTEKARFEAEIHDVLRALGVSWRRGEDVFSAEGSIAAVFGSR